MTKGIPAGPRDMTPISRKGSPSTATRSASAPGAMQPSSPVRLVGVVGLLVHEHDTQIALVGEFHQQLGAYRPDLVVVDVLFTRRDSIDPTRLVLITSSDAQPDPILYQGYTQPTVSRP
jgi:hypothetical protein